MKTCMQNMAHELLAELLVSSAGWDPLSCPWYGWWTYLMRLC